MTSSVGEAELAVLRQEREVEVASPRRQALPRRRCTECELLFRPSRAQQRFCERRCARAHYRRVVLGQPPAVYLDGDDYATVLELRRAGLAYADIGERMGISDGHAWRIVNEQLGEWLPAVSHQCLHCGQPFEARADAKYCGNACRTAASARRQKERERAHKRGWSVRVLQALEDAIYRRQVYVESGVWS